MTFTVLARSAHGGGMGVASATRTLSVGAGVPAAAPGVGVIASQAWTNRALRGLGLDLLAEGLDPDEVIERLRRTDDGFERRQVGLVSATGHTSVHTGAECTEHAGHLRGEGWVVMGNLLTGLDVLDSMAARVSAGLGAGEDLAGLLVDVLGAGDLAGGDSRGRQSAALLVVDDDLAEPRSRFAPTTLVDLRVDDHPAPVAELARLADLHHAARTATGSEQALSGGYSADRV